MISSLILWVTISLSPFHWVGCLDSRFPQEPGGVESLVVEWDELTRSLRSGYWAEMEVRVFRALDSNGIHDYKHLNQWSGEFREYSCFNRNTQGHDGFIDDSSWSGIFLSSLPEGEVWSRGSSWVVKATAQGEEMGFDTNPLKRIFSPYGLLVKQASTLAPSDIPPSLPSVRRLLESHEGDSLVYQRNEAEGQILYVEQMVSGNHAGSWRATLLHDDKFWHLASFLIDEWSVSSSASSWFPQSMRYLEGWNPENDPATVEETSVIEFEEINSRENLLEAWYQVKPDPIELVGKDKGQWYFYKGKMYKRPTGLTQEVLDKQREVKPPISFSQLVLGLLGVLLIAIAFLPSSRLNTKR
jgi:hypothetical protein